MPHGSRPTIAAAAQARRGPVSHERQFHACSCCSQTMKLSPAESHGRLVAHDHGVLCTVHAERGVDAVPVVYAADGDGFVAVPVDRVKPKASPRLQRVRNLESDPRAALLVEHWDRQDWSRLWWVRAELRWQGDDGGTAGRSAFLARRLAKTFPQYRDLPFASIVLLRVVSVTGWSAR